jgi:methylated-DNA-protein-cysteine methyltransferase-like protein
LTARRRTPVKAPVASGWNEFYRVIRTIPAGRVTTYGAIAALAGHPGAARQVGFALAALIGPGSDVPWQRILGAKARGFAVVTIRDPSSAALQRKRLEAEGVRFDASGRVSLAEFGWRKAARGRTKELRTSSSLRSAVHSKR